MVAEIDGTRSLPGANGYLFPRMVVQGPTENIAPHHAQ